MDRIPLPNPAGGNAAVYETYRELRIDYVREHKDRDLAKSLRKVSFEDFIKAPANLASAWSARQAADALGAPYDLYIQFGMWFWSRRSSGGRTNTPQINQMSYTAKSEEAWRVAFEKYLEGRLWTVSRSLANVPQLHPASFEGTSEQMAARTFLLDVCRKSERPWADAIEMWCHSYPVLTPECFVSVVPQDVLNRALDFVALVPREPIVQPTPLPPSALWPSCHGAPDAMDPTSDTCAKCRFTDTCGRLASLVKAEVRRRTGHEEPRKVQLRAPKNKRMREFRAKKRDEAKAAVDAFSSLSAASSMPG